jgi:hypothetical protein
MTVYKEYTTDEYKTVLSQSLSDTFGISDSSIISWFMSQAGARPVINSYNVTPTVLSDEIFPMLRSKGISPILFLIITVNEGGGAGNWINHYASDTSSGALGTATDDADYMSATSNNKSLGVATSAPEVLGGTNYVEDVAGSSTAFYNALPSSSLGGYYMPSTMAGNSWVFATNWSVANQGASAPAVYYSNPYDDLIDTIKSLGGDPFSGTPATPNVPQTPAAGSGTPKTVAATLTGAHIPLPKMRLGNFMPSTIQEGNNISFTQYDTYLIPRIPQVTPKPSSGTAPATTAGNKTNSTQHPAGDVSQSALNALLALQGQTVGNVSTGSYGQCYGLAYWWSKYLGGPDLVGYADAQSIWSDYTWPSGWQAGSGVPSGGFLPGDIVCFYGGTLAVPFGHVGVITTGGDTSQAQMIDQNDWVQSVTLGGANGYFSNLDGFLAQNGGAHITGYARP